MLRITEPSPTGDLTASTDPQKVTTTTDLDVDPVSDPVSDPTQPSDTASEAETTPSGGDIFQAPDATIMPVTSPIGSSGPVQERDPNEGGTPGGTLSNRTGLTEQDAAQNNKKQKNQTTDGGPEAQKAEITGTGSPNDETPWWDPRGWMDGAESGSESTLPIGPLALGGALLAAYLLSQ